MCAIISQALRKTIIQLTLNMRCAICEIPSAIKFIKTQSFFSPFLSLHLNTIHYSSLYQELFQSWMCGSNVKGNKYYLTNNNGIIILCSVVIVKGY